MSRVFRFVDTTGDAGVLTGPVDLSIERQKLDPRNPPKGGAGTPYDVIVVDLTSGTKWKLVGDMPEEEAKAAVVVAMLLYESDLMVILDETVGELYQQMKRSLDQAGLQVE